MAGTYPNLDCSDLVARVRTYLNEVTPDFFTDAEVYRWLSLGAKDIAQRTLCVRRILDAQTTAGLRTVAFNAFKVIHVEYIPSTGRPMMLRKIDPLRTGHFADKGTFPQRWYEFGTSVGIEPVPDGIYELRLYVADVAKMLVGTVTSFLTGWTAGAGWAAGIMAEHTGASSDFTYDTVLSASSNYTFVFTVSGLGSGGTLKPYAGTTPGVPVTTNGYHMQTLVSSSGVPALKFTAANTISFDDLYIYKEADYAAVGDQTELPTAWQPLFPLYATYHGLIKDKQDGPAKLLESIYRNEMDYLRQSIVEIVPDSRNSFKDQ